MYSGKKLQLPNLQENINGIEKNAGMIIDL